MFFRENLSFRCLSMNQPTNPRMLIRKLKEETKRDEWIHRATNQSKYVPRWNKLLLNHPRISTDTGRKLLKSSSRGLSRDRPTRRIFNALFSLYLSLFFSSEEEKESVRVIHGWRTAHIIHLTRINIIISNKPRNSI